MARVTEPLSKGLVTSRDPALLQPGELTDIRNAWYLPGSQALQRVSGRAFYGSASAASASVPGLRDIRFDNGDGYLVAMVTGASAKYRYAPIATTGTFTDLVTLGSAGTQLEAVHYRNRYFLFNGVASGTTSATGSNLVVYLSATATGTAPSTRQNGMRAVTAGPFITTTAAGSFSQSITGYYQYWTTEVARLTQDGVPLVLESTFVGNPTTVLVGSTATMPVLQQPLPLNTITTHWRIYRSPKMDAAGDSQFPNGFMIGELATAAGFFSDTSAASNTGYLFPSAFNTTGQYFSFVSASSMGADDGAVARVTAGAAGTNFAGHGTYGYALGFSGALRGIEVEVQCYIASGHTSQGGTFTNGMVGVTLGRRDSDGGFVGGAASAPGKSAIITATGAGAPQTVLFGSPTDRWFPVNAPGFADTQFDGNFMAMVGCPLFNGLGALLAIDYVKLKIYYAASFDSTVQFPTVVYTFGDITSQVGKNGQPPSSSTGAIYQGCLVVNDVANPNLIRFSFPDDIESFPESYYVPFDELPGSDAIRCIKVVNSRLIIMADRAVWRLNYLPSERDASFDREKCKEPISGTYGCLNAMCACIYSPDGKTEKLAFVSNVGIHSTDGYEFETLTHKLDWRAMFPAGATAIALINDSEKKLLRFYFRNDSFDANETYLCLTFSYAPDHAVEDGLKCGGFMHVRNTDAGGGFVPLESVWSVPRANGDTSVYLGYGGASAAAGAGCVFLETGTTIPSNDASFKWSSRRFYLAGFGNEWRLNDLYNYFSGLTGTATESYTPYTSKTDDMRRRTNWFPTSITATGPGLHSIAFQLGGEGIQLDCAISSGATNVQDEFIVLDGEDFGEQDAGDPSNA